MAKSFLFILSYVSKLVPIFVEERKNDVTRVRHAPAKKILVPAWLEKFVLITK